MKCPKCSYISFDFNQVCPRCTKDISAEQSKLNLPSFRPDPPSLLGALTGEASDSNIGIRMDEMGAAEGMGDQAVFTPEDSQTIEAMEEAFEEGDSIELQIDATPEPGLHFPEEQTEEDVASEIDDLILDDGEPGGLEPEPATDEDLFSLDLDDLTGDETEIAPDEAPLEGQEEAGPDMEDEMEDLSATIATDEALLEQTKDLDISLEPEGASGDEEGDLSLDLGELEENGDSLSELELEPDDTDATLVAEDISLDDADLFSEAGGPGDDDAVTLDAGDLAAAVPGQDEETLTLDDLDDETVVDLEALSLEEPDAAKEDDSKEIPLDTAEMITSEIDMKNLEGFDDLDLEFEPLEIDDK
jgi:hypothetical protein